MKFFVEGADGEGIRIIGCGIDHASIPEDIVDGDQSARPHQDQGTFEIIGVVSFVGIDESEVEAAAFARGNQVVESFERRPEAQINLFFHACLAPVAAGDGGPFLVDVTGDHVAIVGERKGD